MIDASKHLMILLDYSQTCIGNLYQQLKKNDEVTDDTGRQIQSNVEPNLLRHMILNSIRKNNRKFGSKYGQMVICTDNHTYWRKTYYSQYKAHRKKDREDSGINWGQVFEVVDALRDELKKYFPYKVMNVPLAEADDIIGVLAKNFHDEPVLIVSGDQDFIQLQAYPNVMQYAPIQDEFLTDPDPPRFLREHIICGDKRDGVPNFLSADDVLVTKGLRQSPIRKTKLEVWLNQRPEEFCDETTIKNYRRNEKMIDLNQIPPEIQAAILEDWAMPIEGDKSKIYGYFVKYRMKNLLELIRDF
jgi:hypothetical protein